MKLLDVVALLQKLPKLGLHPGNVGTIVEKYEPDVFEVEYDFISFRHRPPKSSDRILYLAVPEKLYDKFFATPLLQELIQQNSIYLITYDIDLENIIKWIPSPNTVNTSKPY